MFESLANYPYENKCLDARPMNQTLFERLEKEKASLEARLVKVNEAIEALKKNPEFTKCLELVLAASR